MKYMLITLSGIILHFILDAFIIFSVVAAALYFDFKLRRKH